MTADELVASGNVALEKGRWGDAVTAFEEAISQERTAAACFGLAMACWWLGENQRCVAECTSAYSLFRQAGDVPSAVQCAVWLGITYKANFANFAAAAGWLGRAEQLLEPLEPGPLHAWTWVARAYKMDDLREAEELTSRAVDIGRVAGDVDLELVGLAQLGLIRVGQGAAAAGFALIDQAMAATLAGERSSLDTVVYACCDMLNACDLVRDVERAAQWCEVADDFVARYGCPFLYAECRIFYASVLVAKGRWDDAERELAAGLRITDGASPALHTRTLVRLADLRIRQGRLEEAEQLLARLGAGVEAEAEEALSLGALLLARGDARAASRGLEQRLHRLADHRWHLAAALDLLADAYVETGEQDAASAAVARLGEVVAVTDDVRLSAVLARACGRVAMAAGDHDAAVGHLEAALEEWSRLDFPFEAARARFDLARSLAAGSADVALDHARRALLAFESLGAALDADRVGAFLRSWGVTPRTGNRAGGAVLTAREQEVLRLLGSGLSNPEIAQRIHVSRKTASHHVSNILTKLNLRNRAEAAAYAVKALGSSGGGTRRHR